MFSGWGLGRYFDVLLPQRKRGKECFWLLGC